MGLELRILGPLEVLRDGVPLRLAGRLRRSLVALLVLHVGEAVSADRLIEELWPGSDEGARARLQVYVSQLRRLLGPEGGSLQTRPGGYALAVDGETVDALRFERMVAAGRAALAAGDPEQAALTLTEALGLWRGQVLADLAYESFAQAAAGRLEELRLRALEDRLEAELALGRHEELVAELERLVAELPLRERLRGQLMLALYRAGRQAEALAAYRQAREVLRDELGLEPGPELRELQRAILRHDLTLRVEPPELRARRHLPAPPTPLVGRRAELDEIGALLRGGSARLVTLTGPGGLGKTRVALAAAHHLADAFTDGVWFVDLAPLRDSDLVPSQIAHALGVEERGGRPLAETLRAHLQARRLLLLLDNFEVVEAAAPVVGELLAAAAELAILVTSRTPLRVSAEHEYRLPPLPPGEAAQLFVARARAVAPGFRRPSEEAAEVAEICRRVDHLPLGIELAAARTRELSAVELLAQLPSPLELASGGPRDLPARQQTLSATIDWSYELLAPRDQKAFAELAVFAGGCTPAAAEVVTGADRGVLASLAAHSLLRERPDLESRPRYAMLETIREYALQRLRASGALRRTREAHAAWCLELAERATAELRGSEQSAWLAQLETEHANLREALAYWRRSGAAELELRLASALAGFWLIHGYVREARKAMEGALLRGADAPAALRAKAVAAASGLALRAGDREALAALGAELLVLSRSLGDERGVAMALDRLASAASWGSGDFSEGTRLYEESRAISERIGDLPGVARTTSNLGYLALKQGDYEHAASLSDRGLDLFRELGETDQTLMALFNGGLAAHLQGEPRNALARFCAGLELARSGWYPDGMIYLLEGSGAALAALGEDTRAARLFGAAQSAAEAAGITLQPFEQEIHDRTLEAVSSKLGPDVVAAALAEGAALDLHEAIAEALAAADELSARAHPRVSAP